jgi:hypothetical protein
VENQKAKKGTPKPIHTEGNEIGTYIIIFDLFSEHRTHYSVLLREE